MHSCFHFIIYYGTYSVKIFIYIYIAKPDHFQSVCFQFACSFIIFSLLFRFIMSSAIQFYHQLGLETVKVNNEIIYTFLSLETNRI